MIPVLHDAWRASPLVWIHRAEARSLARELSATGRDPRLAVYSDAARMGDSCGVPLLRLSDPVMFEAVRALSRSRAAYIGPGAAVMARCYDKYEACRLVSASGIEVPRTSLGSAIAQPAAPIVVKPRFGSDSIGLKLVRRGAVSARRRTEAYLIQEHVGGVEFTIAVARAHVGAPVRIELPEGTPYSFARKYLRLAKRVPFADEPLGTRIRDLAARVSALLEVDWAARIDLIHELSTGRLVFIECDAAPLVGAASVFATSLEASGIDRAGQLRLLLNEER